MATIERCISITLEDHEDWFAYPPYVVAGELCLLFCSPSFAPPAGWTQTRAGTYWRRLDGTEYGTRVRMVRS